MKELKLHNIKPQQFLLCRMNRIDDLCRILRMLNDFFN